MSRLKLVCDSKITEVCFDEGHNIAILGLKINGSTINGLLSFIISKQEFHNCGYKVGDNFRLTIEHKPTKCGAIISDSYEVIYND